ncbi:unnamed protein product [Prorocentrum cordatum]|uniref:Uncharacterized protein n=1 Tax=Prorocentrum cordatum TaxID=2364126 RepID=A0ABN9S623_9DINO|nr:unnamed protein product [Polarella glacialis]
MPIELIQAVMPTVIRALLKNAQSTAALKSAVFPAAHLEADHELCTTMKLTGHYFFQEAARLRQQRRQEPIEGRVVEELAELGVPRPHLWLALAGALLHMGDKVGAQTAVKISQYMDGIRVDQALTNDTLASQVKYCRASYTHERSVMKIFLEASQTGIQPEVLSPLVPCGASIKKGTPPKSHQERLVQLAFDGAPGWDPIPVAQWGSGVPASASDLLDGGSCSELQVGSVTTADVGTPSAPELWYQFLGLGLRCTILTENSTMTTEFSFVDSEESCCCTSRPCLLPLSCRSWSSYQNLLFRGWALLGVPPKAAGRPALGGG